MGVRIAPVAGSGVNPAWMARVAIACESCDMTNLLIVENQIERKIEKPPWGVPGGPLTIGDLFLAHHPDADMAPPGLHMAMVIRELVSKIIRSAIYLFSIHCVKRGL